MQLTAMASGMFVHPAIRLNYFYILVQRFLPNARSFLVIVRQTVSSIVAQVAIDARSLGTNISAQWS